MTESCNDLSTISDIKTTMHYIKPTDDDVKGAMIR